MPNNKKDDKELYKKAEEYYKTRTDLPKIDTRISLDSDETIELQIVKKLFSSRRKSKKRIIKEYEEAMKRRNVERFSPELNKGLNDEQVRKRIEGDFINKTPNKYTKSIASIICSNVFTYFNTIMFIIALFLIAAKANITNLFFLGIVLTNICVGVIQEIRSKIAIDKLRLITSPKAKVIRNGKKIEIDESLVVLDDIIIVSSGNQVIADCIVKQGSIEVDESALTGESLPIKKAVGDLILSGSVVVSGYCIAKVDKIGQDTFSGNLSRQAKAYKKNTSVLRRSINGFITIISLILIPITVLVVANNYFIYKGPGFYFSDYDLFQKIVLSSSSSIIGMIPSGLILLVSAALAVGVINLSKKKTMVKDLYSIERLARVTTLCLDKTGTLTDGTMKVDDVINLSKLNTKQLSDIVSSYLASFEADNQTSLALVDKYGKNPVYKVKNTLPFSSSRKYSALTFEDDKSYALGAYEYVFSQENLSKDVLKIIKEEMSKGNRVIVLAEIEKIENDKVINPSNVICVFSITDQIRKEAHDTIAWFKKNDVNIKIISGDNPLTVSNIAKKCGVDNYDKYISLEGVPIEKIAELIDKYTVFGRVTPDQKEAIIVALKNKKEVVAMTGDGVNDILAMKKADCSIAMNNGSDATKAVAHLVLLDSNFSNMPSVVKEGRRVINNIQLSASLYLMKTIFVMALTVIWIITGKIMNFKYPFTPQMMLILEIVIIGLPSFFLALQPNDKLVRGNFMLNVMKSAVPGALCMFISVFSVMIFKRYISGLELNQINASSLEVLCLNTTGLIPLILLCYPFNIYRGTLALSSTFFTFIFSFFLPRKIIGVSILDSILWKGWVLYFIICVISIAICLITKYIITRVEKRNMEKEAVLKY